MEFKIYKKPLKWFKPNPDNPRINGQAVDQMVAQIERHKFRVPVQAKSTGELVDGHLRLKAAEVMGLKTIPVLFVDDMTEDEIATFSIGVNRMADLADWDEEKLPAWFKRIEDFGIPLNTTGFDFDIRGFSPSMAPASKKSFVSAEDIAKANDGKAEGVVGGYRPKAKITCPHCFEDFEIDT